MLQGNSDIKDWVEICSPCNGPKTTTNMNPLQVVF